MMNRLTGSKCFPSLQKLGDVGQDKKEKIKMRCIHKTQVVHEIPCQRVLLTVLKVTCS